MFTTVTFLMLQPGMMTDQMTLCWVDLGSENNVTWLAPVTCLTLTSLLTLAASYQSRNTMEWVGRSVTMSTTRHSVLAIVLTMTGVCILGPMSYTATLAHTGVVITYQIFRILLIVSVLVRTLSDDQVKYFPIKYQIFFLSNMFGGESLLLKIVCLHKTPKIYLVGSYNTLKIFFLWKRYKAEKVI